MNKTKIEWVKSPDGAQGYTINPLKGKCPRACHYCYARRLYDRFKWNPEPRFDQDILDHAYQWSVEHEYTTNGYFMCSTFEWLWNKDWATEIMIFMETFMKRHRFYTLTKYPERLWTFQPFPLNVWAGVTIDEGWQLAKTLDLMRKIKAPVKFISFEPLQEYIDNVDFLQDGDIDWVIIGARTQPYREPAYEWVEEIVKYADKGNLKVFLKDNLKPMFYHHYLDSCGQPEIPQWARDINQEYRQEIPDDK